MQNLLGGIMYHGPRSHCLILRYSWRSDAPVMGWRPGIQRISRPGSVIGLASLSDVCNQDVFLSCMPSFHESIYGSLVLIIPLLLSQVSSEIISGAHNPSLLAAYLLTLLIACVRCFT